MIYKGILEELGDSETIVTDRGYYTHRFGITRFHKQGDAQENWWKFSYIKIGGAKLRNVMVTPPWRDYLREALGQEVELSIGGKLDKPDQRHTVVAMRTPEAGLLKAGGAAMAVVSVVVVLKSIIGSLLLGAIITTVSWLLLGRIIGAVIGSSGTGALIGFGVGLLSIPYLFINSIRGIITTYRLRAALN